jgi:hypothetical protein
MVQMAGAGDCPQGSPLENRFGISESAKIFGDEIFPGIKICSRKLWGCRKRDEQ